MRVAAWRYDRGCRSLAVNLNAGDATQCQGRSQTSQNNTEEVGEDFDIPEEIEEVIEELIQGLQDSNTIVRCGIHFKRLKIVCKILVDLQFL